jgi:hypothetical protein
MGYVVRFLSFRASRVRCGCGRGLLMVAEGERGALIGRGGHGVWNTPLPRPPLCWNRAPTFLRLL